MSEQGWTIQDQVDILTQCLFDLIYEYPSDKSQKFKFQTLGRSIDGYLERELSEDGKLKGIRVIAHGFLTANFVVDLDRDDSSLHSWTKFQELAFRIRLKIAIETKSVTGRFPYL